MIEFRNKILFVGYGAVADCTLPVLLKHIKVPAKNITLMDFEDKTQLVEQWTAKGVTFVQDRVTEVNIDVLLSKYLGKGDLLIDLAWNIDACAIIGWCHDHGVMYINTSVEEWDPYRSGNHPTEKTLYWRHLKLRKLRSKWKTKGVSAVIEHGANPGLISHFTKQGLLDIGEASLEAAMVKGKQAEMVKQAIKDQSFNVLAQSLGVKVIHVSERDTQITNKPKKVDEFVNTWSIEGFREEGTTTAEMGWGTHEKTLPAHAYRHRRGPKNQICLARMGMNTWVRTMVPGFSIQGMVVRHGEAFTLSDRLTVWEGKKAVYRPTVHYAYCPCDEAIASLNELRGYNYELQSKLRIMTDEITTGSDILGALIMGHGFKSWWTGSALSIEESRLLIPHHSATTMQVAISVVAACMWMIENPHEGLITPESIPHDYVLDIARPWLGKFISERFDWTPLRDYKNHFEGFNKPDFDLKDPWQFKNFLIKDGD